MSDVVPFRRAAAASVSSPQVVTPEPPAVSSRGRKLRALSGEEVEAARALIQSPPPPLRGNRITFPPDHTPAEPDNPPPSPAPASSPPSAGKRPRGRRRKDADDAPDPALVGTATGDSNATAPSPAPKPCGRSRSETSDEIRRARTQIAPHAPAPAPAAAQRPPAPRLSDAEMAQVIALIQQKYGPVLSLDEAAEISKLSKQTLRERVCEGCYADAVVRGRPLRFWAHRFLPEVMS